MTTLADRCVECGEALQQAVRFCPFCGVAQARATMVQAPAAMPTVPATPAPSRPPLATSPIVPNVTPSPARTRPDPPVSVPPAPPPSRPAPELPPRPPRLRRPRSAAQRQAHAAALRKLALAAVILGCGAILWHHLTDGPHGTLLVRLVRSEAGRVLVDGTDAGLPGQPISLPPGRHLVGFGGGSWNAAPVTIRLQDGETRTVTLTPIPRRASLSLDSLPPAARLSLDGRWLGRAPHSLSLPPGRYRVGASLPGRQPLDLPVTLEAGEQRALTLTLASPPTRILHLVAPAGGWSVPVTLASGDRFTLLFQGRIRVRSGGHVVLLEGGPAADLGRLDDRSLSFAAAGDTSLPVELRIRAVADPGIPG